MCPIKRSHMCVLMRRAAEKLLAEDADRKVEGCVHSARVRGCTDTSGVSFERVGTRLSTAALWQKLEVSEE